MTTFPPTESLRINGLPVYIDRNCGEATTWSPEEFAEYGPIEEQGCDRCESGKADWVQVRVAL